MKLQCDQQTLHTGVGVVVNVVPARTPMPLVSNILLEVRGDTLTLMATDLDTWISTRVAVSGVEDGAVAVPGRKFAEMVRELPPGEVKLEAEGAKVTLKTDHGTYSVMGNEPEEFPRFPSVSKGSSFTVAGALLRSMADRTAFAASEDETRPALCGVLWSVAADAMTMVATDGFRLARARRKLAGGPDTKVEAIVPPDALGQMVRLVSAEGSAEVRVTLSENYVQFEVGDSLLVSRVISGPYPSLEQVIPKANPKLLVVASEALAPALRRAQVLSATGSNQVKLTLREGEIALEAETEDFGGRAFETVAAEYSGEPLEVLYNAAYLGEVLRKIGSGAVRFELDTSVSAGVIRPLEPDPEEEYLCLLMPLRPLEG